MVSEKIFFKFTHYKSMETLHPQGGASLDPMGLIGRTFVWDHQTLQHTKYISCGQIGPEEKIF